LAGLLGKNSAGKSTLLKAFIGTLYPLSGHISANNFCPADRKPSFFEIIYFIPEEGGVPRLSVRSYLDLYVGFYPLFDENIFFTGGSGRR
jgi:ABC-type multidrug transport system ATPase subunit